MIGELRIIYWKKVWKNTGRVESMDKATVRYELRWRRKRISQIVNLIAECNRLIPSLDSELTKLQKEIRILSGTLEKEKLKLPFPTDEELEMNDE